MRKYLVVWLLAAQIGTVGVMSALVAPTAVAADAKFSKAVGTPLKAAQEAIQKKNWDVAMTKLKDDALTGISNYTGDPVVTGE